jgi:hypothetical protein
LFPPSCMETLLLSYTQAPAYYIKRNTARGDQASREGGKSLTARSKKYVRPGQSARKMTSCKTLSSAASFAQLAPRGTAGTPTGGWQWVAVGPSAPSAGGGLPGPRLC